MADINFVSVKNKKLLTPKNVTNIDDQSFETLKDEDILNTAALLLRKSVLRIKTNKLPQNVTVENLKKGEASVPQDLLDFFFTMIAGENQKRKKIQNAFDKSHHIVKMLYIVFIAGKLKFQNTLY